MYFYKTVKQVQYFLYFLEQPILLMLCSFLGTLVLVVLAAKYSLGHWTQLVFLFIYLLFSIYIMYSIFAPDLCLANYCSVLDYSRLSYDTVQCYHPQCVHPLAIPDMFPVIVHRGHSICPPNHGRGENDRRRGRGREATLLHRERYSGYGILYTT